MALIRLQDNIIQQQDLHGNKNQIERIGNYSGSGHTIMAWIVA